MEGRDRAVYYLILCEGGLISDFQKVASKTYARQCAEKIWKRCDYEADDLKVFDDEGFIVWQPPKEG